MPTLIKNPKDWNKWVKLNNLKVATIDDAPRQIPEVPESYPCFVDCSIIPLGNRFQIKHFLFYKGHASQLLAIK